MSSSTTVPAPCLITMGDPCGIGPEIIVKAWEKRRPGRAIVVGDPAVIQRAIAQTRSRLVVNPIASLPDEVPLALPGAITVCMPPGMPAGLEALSQGQVHAAAGQAAAACIRSAALWAQAHSDGPGQVLIVTAPIHKEALAAAGEPFPGHTELLQSLAGGAPVRMMLANDELKTVLVTIHMSLRKAIESLSTASISQTISIAHAAANAWGQSNARIAVAGLNPHAGEGGLFGDEEIKIIAPAIHEAQARGWKVSGPHAPDTVFMRARHTAQHPAEFDLVIAMVHDHGLIPVKYLGLDRGVNVTLGLPYVRTSPDHGTAFDIVGKGVADPGSLMAAMDLGERLAMEGAQA